MVVPFSKFRHQCTIAFPPPTNVVFMNDFLRQFMRKDQWRSTGQVAPEHNFFAAPQSSSVAYEWVAQGTLNLRTTAAIDIKMVSRYSKVAMRYTMRQLTASSERRTRTKEELYKEDWEREFEREREKEERDRAFELQKLELEARAARAQPVESMQIPDQPVKIRMHDVMQRFNPKEDVINLFLVLFERQAKMMNIPAENQVAQLISLLPPDIVELIAREPEEDAKKYEYVKALLLQRFKLSAEKFRQLFNKHQKAFESTWYDFYYELKNYLEGWLNGLNIKTFEQLKDLMLVDQIKKRTSTDFKEHFMDE
ncbi:hypothetical protein AVEN_165737-1 [Araneus ventricosus]|uniref:SCAN box domain-containing protein n=1 Tax=Araneus ventricosus TaxID=182803 RepID=A0A4Y2C385_ARAVE|nr:hypothetical protein AVEN_165737-1 [Araneus ventricosus]